MVHSSEGIPSQHMSRIHGLCVSQEGNVDRTCDADLRNGGSGVKAGIQKKRKLHDSGKATNRRIQRQLRGQTGASDDGRL